MHHYSVKCHSYSVNRDLTILKDMVRNQHLSAKNHYKLHFLQIVLGSVESNSKQAADTPEPLGGRSC